jgi:S1 RNA binding domain
LQVVVGIVKRVERFGVFVSIANSALTGLAHVSELADSYVGDPAAKFQPGHSVRVVVMALDRNKSHISLSTRPSVLAAAGVRVEGGGTSGSESDGGQVEQEGQLGGAKRRRVVGAPVAIDADLEDVLAAAYDESDSGSTQTSDAGLAGDAEADVEARQEVSSGDGEGEEGLEPDIAADDADSTDSNEEDNADEQQMAGTAWPAGSTQHGYAINTRSCCSQHLSCPVGINMSHCQIHLRR